ncbi:MAG: zinc ribbon domain-containing protein, partial [Pseudomonadota bacterium]
ADLQVAGPIYEPLNAHFWEAAEQGILKIQRCLDCDRHIFYPRPICPFCWSDALTWVVASGRGWLKSYSEIFKPGHQGWIPATPYLVGLVTLEEGPTLMSHIIAPDNAVAIGDRLSFAATRIGTHTLPCFRKDD